MKHSKFTFKNKTRLLSLIFLLTFGIASAQNNYTITGRLIDSEHEAVMFANVVLKNPADSSILLAAVSNEQGYYHLRYNQTGTFILSVSYLGYRRVEKEIAIVSDSASHLEPIIMQQIQNELELVTISRERIKAKHETDKTTYYVNEKMRQSSNTGADIAAQIPGVQNDLFHNITLEGSDKIIIQVNGTRRSAEFLSRINSDKIDRIEVKTTAGAQYDAEISGLINVILKKPEKGTAGYMYADIPVKNNEIYSFPSASIDFTFDKLNVYTSYNGIFSYFDVRVINRKTIFTEPGHKEFITQSDLFQKNRSHKGHFGADYRFNKNNRLNIYGFAGRFQNEQDGRVWLTAEKNDSVINSYEFLKDDRDQNNSAYASVNYELLLNSVSQLDVNADFYLLNSRSTTTYSDTENEMSYTNSVSPETRLLNVKLDYRTQIFKTLTAEAGAKQSLKILRDALSPSFNYRDQVSAAYLTFVHKGEKLQTGIGVRCEYAQLENADDYKNQNWYFLPDWHLQYNFSEKHHLKFDFKKQIIRPSVYSLNPRVSQVDLFTQQKGNPALSPVSRYYLSAELGMNYGDNFFTAGAFYRQSMNVHEYFTQLSPAGRFEKEAHNIGTINQAGIKVFGSLKPFENIMLNPHIQLYRVQTHANTIARESGISNRSRYDFQSELSAIYLFKSKFSVALSVKYNSPITGIQTDYREDVLYFLSAEKTFRGRLKIGITTAAPFKNNFTYSAYEIEAENFKEISEEDIQMSVFPVWFKLKYNFSSGKNSDRKRRLPEFKEQKPSKGF
jgi:hypothetical protein